MGNLWRRIVWGTALICLSAKGENHEFPLNSDTHPVFIEGGDPAPSLFSEAVGPTGNCTATIVSPPSSTVVAVVQAAHCPAIRSLKVAGGVLKEFSCFANKRFTQGDDIGNFRGSAGFDASVCFSKVARTVKPKIHGCIGSHVVKVGDALRLLGHGNPIRNRDQVDILQTGKVTVERIQPNPHAIIASGISSVTPGDSGGPVLSWAESEDSVEKQGYFNLVGINSKFGHPNRSIFTAFSDESRGFLKRAIDAYEKRTENSGTKPLICGINYDPKLKNRSDDADEKPQKPSTPDKNLNQSPQLGSPDDLSDNGWVAVLAAPEPSLFLRKPALDRLNQWRKLASKGGAGTQALYESVAQWVGSLNRKQQADVRRVLEKLTPKGSHAEVDGRLKEALLSTLGEPSRNSSTDVTDAKRRVKEYAAQWNQTLLEAVPNNNSVELNRLINLPGEKNDRTTVETWAKGQVNKFGFDPLVRWAVGVGGTTGERTLLLLSSLGGKGKKLILEPKGTSPLKLKIKGEEKWLNSPYVLELGHQNGTEILETIKSLLSEKGAGELVRFRQDISPNQKEGAVPEEPAPAPPIPPDLNKKSTDSQEPEVNEKAKPETHTPKDGESESETSKDKDGDEPKKEKVPLEQAPPPREEKTAEELSFEQPKLSKGAIPKRLKGIQAFEQVFNARNQGWAIGKGDNDWGSPAHFDSRWNHWLFTLQDADTAVHEGTHFIQAQLNNLKGNNQEAIFIPGKGILYLKRPPVLRREIPDLIPQVLRAFRFKDYVNGESDSSNRSVAGGENANALYLWDEWAAYLNGASVSAELREKKIELTRQETHTADWAVGGVEFIGYALGTLMAAHERVGKKQYAVDDYVKLKAAFALQTERAIDLLKRGEKLDGSGAAAGEKLLEGLRTDSNQATQRMRKFLIKEFGADWTQKTLGVK